MDGFGGFILTFLIFIFAVKWIVVKRDGGSLRFPTSFGGRNRKNTFYDDSSCRVGGRQTFLSDDDSFTNIDNGFTNTGSFRNHAINPANGLPMVNGFGSTDVMGNTYGMDSNDHMGSHSFDDSSLFSSDSGLSDGFNSGSRSGISDL